MITNKFVAALTVLLTSTAIPSNTSPEQAYIMGFDDGSEAITNAINAEMCAKHYKSMGAQKPGPECYKFFENYQLRALKYEKIKKELEKSNERKKKTRKSRSRNKKNSN